MTVVSQAPIWSNFIDMVVSQLKVGNPVRLKTPDGGRVHIDRLMPFLCVHERRDQPAAEGVTVSNASYLLTQDLSEAAPLINRVGELTRSCFRQFIMLEIAEFDRDEVLQDDSPFLPPFKVLLIGSDADARSGASAAAVEGIAESLAALDVKYRTPRVSRVEGDAAATERPSWLGPKNAWCRVVFAPIYRQPESESIYPDLFSLAVANILDAVLQGLHAFVATSTSLTTPNHRALGRRVFIDTVTHVDELIDGICRSFDFLLAVTPINTAEAYNDFLDIGCKREPRLLYRPLSVDVDEQKQKLFSIPFDQLEDPVLVDLYREKQQELDIQLSMLRSRESMEFRESSRILYGSVEKELRNLALSILCETHKIDKAKFAEDDKGVIGSAELRKRAEILIKSFQADYSGFHPSIEIRNDIPAGVMVIGPRLLISRITRVRNTRVAALLQHEIGVHLLTYFTGDAQGLRLFRSGLAGYEGDQEGVAVFAEYAMGGMTAGRLRLVAARVIACYEMFDGAKFADVFQMLRNDFRFSDQAAFNVTVRVFRSGGFAKDAIYLRGLVNVLSLLGRGGNLKSFWVGKIAISHLDIIEELRMRGLLQEPALEPPFLHEVGAKRRLERARQGLTPIDLIAA